MRLQLGSHNGCFGLVGLFLMRERPHAHYESVALRYHEYLLSGVVDMTQPRGGLYHIVASFFALGKVA